MLQSERARLTRQRRTPGKNRKRRLSLRKPDEDRQPKTEIKAPRGTTAKSLDLKALTEGQTGSLPEGDYTIISVSPEIRKDSALRFGTILVRAGTDYLIVSGISPDNLTTWDSWVPEPNAVFTVLKPQPSKVLKDGIPQIVQDPASKAGEPIRITLLGGDEAEVSGRFYQIAGRSYNLKEVQEYLQTGKRSTSIELVIAPKSVDLSSPAVRLLEQWAKQNGFQVRTVEQSPNR